MIFPSGASYHFPPFFLYIAMLSVILTEKQFENIYALKYCLLVVLCFFCVLVDGESEIRFTPDSFKSSSGEECFIVKAAVIVPKELRGIR